MDVNRKGGVPVERDLTHDLESRDWQELADAWLLHDTSEPIVTHATELLHTVSTSLRLACGEKRVTKRFVSQAYQPR